MLKISVTDYMVGASLISKALEGHVETMSLVLTGHFDDTIKNTFAYMAMLKAPTEEKKASITLESEEVVAPLERMKDMIRNAFQMVFAQADAAEKDQRKKKHEQLLAELKNSNKPHPMGTVSELAARFGVSKSEIRRRKTDNTLAELFLSNPQAS